RLERSLDALDACGEHLLAVERRLGAVGDGPRQLDEVAADLGELGDDLAVLRARLAGAVGELGVRTSRLRGDLNRLRRLDVGQLFERFSHLISERAAALGKTVHFATRGEHVELDSTVMERLVEPLTHLVQNALHHGLEGESERLGAGKRGTGTLTLEARAEGRTVHLAVADDGRGIDLEGLRRRAEEHGLVDPGQRVDQADAEAPHAADDLELLYLPGLSTQDEVTTGAGRGVGMDAVRRALAELGGRLRVTTRPGEGTRFTIEVPATQLVTEALLVRIGGRPFAVPLPAVERLLHVNDTLLVEQEGARFLDDGGVKVELIHAARRLGLEPGPPPSMPGATGVAVRLAAPFEGLALEVEEVYETREVVIKPLGHFLAGATVASGAFVDGDGRAVLVLDPRAMADVRAGDARETSPATATGRTATVLVADDSLSVRRVLERRLKRAGVEVLTARDGAEALDLLLDAPVDALITDLEMPQLSGAALIRRLRRRPRWRRLPILVITGRGDIGDHIPGADAVVHKPVPEERLAAWLRSVLAIRATDGADIGARA
ncbi:MAG: response regulator, partial [Acidobacteriota bacterium]